MKVMSSASGFLLNHCDLKLDPFWQVGCSARLRYVADTLAVWSHTCPFQMFDMPERVQLCPPKYAGNWP